MLASSGLGGDDVAAVGLSGQMHGAVVLDRGGEVLRPAILWNDQRTAAECDAIRAALGPRDDLAVRRDRKRLDGRRSDVEADEWTLRAHVTLA